MDVRSAFGSLQLPVALAGVALFVWAVSQMAAIHPVPDRGGLPGGLALFFLAVLAWFGFVVTALGLAIPAGDGTGVRFSRPQRGLFVLAAVAAVASVVLPLAALGTMAAIGASGNLIGLAWLVPTAVAVLALVGGIGWRAVESVAPRLGIR